MKDGDQILLGRDVAYDVRSQTGYMWDGLSRIEKSYYGGAEVRKVGAKVYDVDSGRFTTCDLAEPDFWFTAGKLRIYQGDKLVGKPISPPAGRQGGNANRYGFLCLEPN